MIVFKIIMVIILPFLAFGACWLGGTLGIKMARRNKKTGCKTPEFRKKSSPPPPPTTGSNAQKRKRIGYSAKDLVFIGEKIGEGLRAGAGIEETPPYKIEGVDLAEPEQQPKENPYSKPALEISADFEAVAKGLQAVVAAFQRLMEALTPIRKELSEIIELYPNKRVVHLAKHARKERVRKKNINRILKWYARGGH